MTSTGSCLSRDCWAHRAFYKHSMNGIAVSNVSETGFVAGVWRLERRACMVLIRVLNNLCFSCRTGANTDTLNDR